MGFGSTGASHAAVLAGEAAGGGRYRAPGCQGMRFRQHAVDRLVPTVIVDGR
jgi:hypothetical protein